MAVWYNTPLPPQDFIKHAVWEGLGEVDERQMRKGFDNCLLKRWICLTQRGFPEFTDEGEKRWSDIRHMLQKRVEEQNASRAERTLIEEQRRGHEELTDWQAWSDAWKAGPDCCSY